jgi:hypothetical protein
VLSKIRVLLYNWKGVGETGAAIPVPEDYAASQLVLHTEIKKLAKRKFIKSVSFKLYKFKRKMEQILQ